MSLRISVRWPAEAAGISVKVRDAKHPLEESLRAAAAPADRGPVGTPAVSWAVGSIVTRAGSQSVQSLSCRFGIVVFFTMSTGADCGR